MNTETNKPVNPMVIPAEHTPARPVAPIEAPVKEPKEGEQKVAA